MLAWHRNLQNYRWLLRRVTDIEVEAEHRRNIEKTHKVTQAGGSEAM